MRFSSRLGRCAAIIAISLLSAAALQAHAPFIVLSPTYMNFVVAPGDPTQSKKLILGNGTHGRMAWTATVATTTGNWLSVNPPSGALPGLIEMESTTLTVSATVGSLPAGVYYGTITFVAPGDSPPCDPCSPPASNNPQVIEVALTVTTTGQAAPGIGIAPDSLFFEGTATTGRSYNLTVQINNLGGGSLNWTATAETTTGGDWLSVTPLNRTALIVTASVGNLVKGTYSGRVTVSAPDSANKQKSLPVTFSVRDPVPASLLLSTTAMNFSVLVETNNPAPQNLTISNAGEGALNWRVQAFTNDGGSWLTVSTDGGSGPGAVSVALLANSLAPGVYRGVIIVTADGAVNSPGQVTITLTVRPPQPTFEARGIVNAASFSPGFVAPGEIISIFGAYLGPRDPVVATLDPATQKLPTTLGGTTITFDGIPAALFFVSSNQVNLQVPYEVGNRTSSRMVVNVAGTPPTETSVSVSPATPGIFTIDGTRAAALNQNLTLNSPDNPAAVGSVVVLYFTGQGLLDRKVETGALAPSSPPFPAPALDVGVNMDGFNARIAFAGLAPGFVGLMQVNVEVPRGVRSGQVRVALGVGFNIAPAAATISVQ